MSNPRFIPLSELPTLAARRAELERRKTLCAEIEEDPYHSALARLGGLHCLIRGKPEALDRLRAFVARESKGK